MPEIDFCFGGWVRNYKPTKAIDANGKEVDVSKMKSETLVKRLRAGKLFLSLQDALDATSDTEIELTDYDVSL